MPAPNHTSHTRATRFQFGGPRARSQSPCRPTLRKSQFAARELDPLLHNLSPDSTLKALQATDTITGMSEKHDALARSIAEASPTEREIGIRAALAAQKLKLWHREVSNWAWPARRDRGWGAGFLPPQGVSVQTSTDTGVPVPYLGFLPAAKVKEHQDRIEDIRDGIQALDLEEVKDHIFNAYVPQRSASAPYSLENGADDRDTGYGRMRDFTALITATIIQALPELAKLTMLLDTWDVRLSVLRQIPEITQAFRSTKAGVQTAFTVVRSTDTGPLVTMDECETTKHLLGGKVAALGTKVDRLLDMLEGKEDSLPKIWIDTLEDVENEYATWVVEAEHIAIRNHLLAKSLALDTKTVPIKEARPGPLPLLKAARNSASPTDVEKMNAGTEVDLHEVGTPVGELPPSHFFDQVPSTRYRASTVDGPHESSLAIVVPKQGHQRGVSEASMANSTFSAISDLSSAEIVDAQSTQVLMSPKISVVDNPFRTSRDELSWFANPDLHSSSQSESRPPMLQRASTASIELISRNSIKQVNLTRSRSHDVLHRKLPVVPEALSPPLPHSRSPSQALKQLSGVVSHPANQDISSGNELKTALMAENSMTTDLSSAGVSPTPSLLVKPLQLRSKEVINVERELPALPRRSSKRLSRVASVDVEDDMPLIPNEAFTKSSGRQDDYHTYDTQDTDASGRSLEAKIRDVLRILPNEIQLGGEDENDDVLQPSSTPSKHLSSSVPTLRPAPRNSDRATTQSASGDIRAFHLTNTGHARNSLPITLFVRAVGERVMVRVGGGWTDLADYLREYSLHHGRRGVPKDDLETAHFPLPPTHQRDSSTFSATAAGTSLSRTNSTSMSSSPQRRSVLSTTETEDLAQLNIGKSRKGGKGNSSNASSSTPEGVWTMPPVPPIPTTYTMQSPTMVITTVDGVTNTDTIQPLGQRSVSTPANFPTSTNGRTRPSVRMSNSQSNGIGSYTLFGAVGTTPNGRRAITPNPSTAPARESWAEGMAGRARALSSGTTILHGPTTTTTTIITSRSTPKSRRISAFVSLSPAKSLNTNTNSNSSTRPATILENGAGLRAEVPPQPKVEVETPRVKNRMSFSDVGGIRRVFFRRKSGK